MLFELPDKQTLYQALVDRDPAFEGRALVGVVTTGIFCRLTCPARKPLLENCRFYATSAEASQAGFRPCKRCKPLGAEAEQDEQIQLLLTALEKQPYRRWQQSDISKMGFDPSTIRRKFKRHFGQTFLDMARQRRLQLATDTLAEGQRVIDAQQEAGFASAAAFRQAFARWLGIRPADLKANALLRADWMDTPLGSMLMVCDASHLHLLEFSDRKGLPRELQRLYQFSKGHLGLGEYPLTLTVKQQLTAYFEQQRSTFDLPLALHGTAFQKQVWHELQNIPHGTACSYSDIARQLDQPTAVRAVARANGANQLAIVIPCHRVIGADGSLTGYGGGLWRKQKLIELERAHAQQQQG